MDLTLQMIAWVQWLMLYTPAPTDSELMRRLERIEEYLIRRFNRESQ